THPVAVTITLLIAPCQVGKRPVPAGQVRSEIVQHTAEIVFIELRQSDRLRPRNAGMSVTLAHQLGRMALSPPRPSVDFVEYALLPHPEVAQQASLAPSELGELIVALREERSLAMAHQRQRTHAPSPSFSWSRRIPRSQRS